MKPVWLAWASHLETLGFIWSQAFAIVAHEDLKITVTVRDFPVLGRVMMVLLTDGQKRVTFSRKFSCCSRSDSSRSRLGLYSQFRSQMKLRQRTCARVPSPDGAPPPQGSGGGHWVSKPRDSEADVSVSSMMCCFCSPLWPRSYFWFCFPKISRTL